MTREEIVEAISDDKMMPYIEPYQLSEIVNFVIKNYHPSLPSNLDDAAEKNFETMEVLEHENIFEETHRKIFKAGAEWMAGQGWHEEAVIKGSYDVVWLNYNVELPIDLAKYFKPGDNVIVQIRKK